jgi:hypothetical protein
MFQNAAPGYEDKSEILFGNFFAREGDEENERLPCSSSVLLMPCSQSVTQVHCSVSLIQIDLSDHLAKWILFSME